MEHDDRGVAEQRFYRIVQYTGDQYNHPKLLGLMHEFATPGKSKDNFLQAFFNTIGSSIQEQDDVDLSDNKTEQRIREKVVEFADYLIDNFFLPLKASAKKAKQLSQAVYNYSTPSTSASGQSRSSTADRRETLGDACLRRDRHRCVIIA